MAEQHVKVLVVDDELHVRLIVKAYFAPYQVDVIDTKDGNKALEIMKKEDIALAILDYNMPIMGGQEILESMLSDEKLSGIPVIIYTSGKFDKDKVEELKSESSAFIEKTNLGDELIPTVKEILDLRLRVNED
jgi:CheY-like chemotaxis protein